MIKRCVVVGASDLKINLKDYLLKDDFIIAADKGWLKCKEQNIQPHLIVGDFDSSKKPKEDFAKIIVLPKEKDDTDSYYIARYIIENNFTHAVFFAMTGGDRIEHTIANIQMLNFLSKNKINAKMIDEKSQFVVITDEEISLEYKKDCYFSVFSFSKSEGVSIKNAKYVVEDDTITNDYPIGISNEFLLDTDVKIQVKKGSLLIIITKKDK